MVITGLELGSKKIKLVRLKRTASGGEILEASTLPLSSLNKEKAIKSRHLVSSLPLSNALIRYLTLPSTSEAEIKEMVNLEAPQLVPYNPQEVIIDYIILKKEKGYSKIMAIIAPKEKVKAKLNLLQKAGLEVEALELSPLPLCRLLFSSDKSDNYYSKKVGLLNIDFPLVEILFLQKGEIFFTRSFNLKGEFQERLCDEIQKIFLQKKVDRLFLSGEFQKELPSFLKERLKVCVEVIDPARSAKGKAPMESLRDNLCQYSLAIGLALRKEDDLYASDLLPLEIKEKRVLRKKRNSLRKAMFLIILLFILSFSIINLKFRRLNSQLLDIQKEVAEIEGTASEVEIMKKKIDLVNRQMKTSFLSLDLLKEINLLAPQTISLNLFLFDHSKSLLTIEGLAEKSSEVYDFKGLLEKSTFFEGVKLDYVRRKRLRNEWRVQFRLSCPLK